MGHAWLLRSVLACVTSIQTISPLVWFMGAPGLVAILLVCHIILMAPFICYIKHEERRLPLQYRQRVGQLSFMGYGVLPSSPSGDRNEIILSAPPSTPSFDTIESPTPAPQPSILTNSKGTIASAPPSPTPSPSHQHHQQQLLLSSYISPTSASSIASTPTPTPTSVTITTINVTTPQRHVP
jgi:hypothetical protein